VHVNPGGEPERDDTGLPPVDIEIPDDARDLDRDVQAYYRELRAQRRRQRGRRLGWPLLAKDGIVLPLLACCMILALITGTLLTVFTATSDQTTPGLPAKVPATGTASAARDHSSAAASSPASPSSAASARTRVPATAAASDGSGVTLSGVPLPAVTLTVAGMPPVTSPELSGSMLVLLPPRCQCAAALRWLTAIGLRAGAPTYLVATAQTRPLALRLYGELGVRLSNSVSLAMDARGVLPAAYPPHGLTAVLISGSKVVSVASVVTTASNPAAITRALLG
jgi:hypothetical protein